MSKFRGKALGVGAILMALLAGGSPAQAAEPSQANADTELQKSVDRELRPHLAATASLDRSQTAPVAGPDSANISTLVASLGLRAVAVDVEANEVYYMFVNEAGLDTDTGLFCLDAKLQTIGNGGTVQLWECNAGDQQQWAVYNGLYLKNRASLPGRTLVLDAKAQTIGNGGTIQLWDYNGGPQQQWSPDPSGYWRNGASPSGRTLVLDAKAQEIRNGGKIQLWDYNGGPQQVWGPV